MSDQENIPEGDRVLRRPDVLAATGLTRSALDRELRAGRFPAPFRLSDDPRARSIGWSHREVQRWIAERVTGPRVIERERAAG